MRQNKIVLIIFFIIHALIFLRADASFSKLIGKNLILSVDKNSGRFNLYKRQDENGRYLPLLFEDKNLTTYFKFYKNKQDMDFGFGGSGRLSDIEIVDDSIIYYWKYDKIKIELKYSLGSSKENILLDTLVVDLNITNSSGRIVKMDFYFCIDTYLGEKTGRHFNISDGTFINAPKEIKDPDLLDRIEYIKSGDKDELNSVNILFNTPLQVKPSRIFAANWKSVQQSIGKYAVPRDRDFNLTPYSMNDSALFIEYNDQDIIPYKDNSYRFVLSLNNEIKEVYLSNFEKLVVYNGTEDNTHDVNARRDQKNNKNMIKDESQNKNNVKNIADVTADVNNIKKNNIDYTNVDSMDLKDLLKLLDTINLKLKADYKLSEDDIKLTEKIYEEIKKRRLKK